MRTPDPLLPPGTKAWVLSDGKIGDEVQCFGIAEALGLRPERRLVRPRRTFAMLMPYGPIDPREAPHRENSPIAPPFPDIVFAAGRRTVAYLRRLKKASGGKTFTVFVKDPYLRSGTADVIWVPEHDRLRGDNVVVTLTPAHRVSADLLAAARAQPDPRIAHLRRPCVALVLGGPSTHHSFSDADEKALLDIATRLIAQGQSLMVTPSRRTPSQLLRAIEAKLLELQASPGSAFVWDGSGGNPYFHILAHADAIIVTGDSVNMVAEAAATGAPVHVYEPSGGHRKITRYIDRLVQEGAVRRWAGQIENWSYSPIDATPAITADIGRRYRKFLEVNLP
jgi:mitochondrial fission protein ELM1